MRSLLSAALIGAALAALPAAPQEPVDRAMLARIKDEGLQRSRAQELYFALTDGIGARLTGSPSIRRRRVGRNLGLRSSHSPMPGWSRSHFRVAGPWKKSR